MSNDFNRKNRNILEIGDTICSYGNARHYKMKGFVMSKLLRWEMTVRVATRNPQPTLIGYYIFLYNSKRNKHVKTLNLNKIYSCRVLLTEKIEKFDYPEKIYT